MSPFPPFFNESFSGWSPIPFLLAFFLFLATSVFLISPNYVVGQITPKMVGVTILSTGLFLCQVRLRTLLAEDRMAWLARIGRVVVFAASPNLSFPARLDEKIIA